MGPPSLSKIKTGLRFDEATAIRSLSNLITSATRLSLTFTREYQGPVAFRPTITRGLALSVFVLTLFFKHSFCKAYAI